MTLRIASILVVGLLSSLCTSAEIREIRSFPQIESVLTDRPADTLLVFDIDNTLITPTTALGSDPWYYCLYEAAGKKPGESLQVDLKVLKVWNDTQRQIKIRPAEFLIPEWVGKRQVEGYRTMGLTARSEDILDVTLRQIRSVGLNMEKNSPLTSPMRLDKSLIGTGESAQFQNGVLAVGETNNKGIVFMHFMSKIAYKPKRIVFVDDKIKNVKAMEAEVPKLGLPFIAFRYGALDQQVAAMRCDAAAVKKQWLSAGL